MASTQPGWMIYKQQMGLLHHGDALWEPAPIYSYTRIRLGDVGYIRRGCFHLLFSAGCPLGSRQLGVDVPDSFELLDVGHPVRVQPRLPGYLCTSTVKETGTDLSASVSATPFLEPGASFSFELTEKRGAALITNYHTYREDIEPEATFEEYTKRHYSSWVAFARRRHGNDIKPVLVSGIDMTKDFAMMAYSDNDTYLSSSFTASVPILASASVSVWGTWHTQGLVHTNCGPQLCTPPSLSGTVGLRPSDIVQVDAAPDEFNQCVFVRYYTMRWRALMFPKVMKAAAGPHDLGPGKNYDETLSELTTNLSRGSDDGYDSSGDDLKLYHNISSEKRDVFDEIAEYVFQNSEAEAVLMHHRDTTQIREGMPEMEMPNLLFSRKPGVNVDNNGVGRLVHRSQQQPTKSLPGSSACTIEHSEHNLPGGSDPGLDLAVYNRLMENITKLVTEPRVRFPSGTYIPQRPYKEGAEIPDRATGKTIRFATIGGEHFPAALALAGHYDFLMDGGAVVFTEQNQTLNLRIEWPGYDGWGAQIRTVNYQEEPKGITRAKLVNEIAKRLENFIETKRSVAIDPNYASYRVGPGGIELRHIRITSLEQVSRGSWQPRLVLSWPEV